MRSKIRLAILVAASVSLQGCATIHREPFTEAQQVDAEIPGISLARFWADAPDAARRMSPTFAGAQGERTMLALSGGSDNGAYGAGLLNGWSRSGTRPEFTIVTGVSTGALIAPLAFLGPDQDATLERVFTTSAAKDIYRGRFAPSIPLSPSAASTKPLARLIGSVMTDALIDRVGREHARGRRLFVGTANLDAQRMVIWNMGAIAASDAPGRYLLFRQVLLASSAIPAFFTPVMIESRRAGRTISEMHVDGSTTAQMLTLPDEAITGDRPAAGSRPQQIYLIVNNKLNGEFRLVNPKTIPIASRSISLNLRSSMVGTVGLSYLYAKARGIDFNLSFIDKDYPGEDHKLFDNAYMRGLYGHGLALGQSGDFWKKRPPDQDE
jgi:Patatin-like phospholipase